jgi:hypothetical protein
MRSYIWEHIGLPVFQFVFFAFVGCPAFGEWFFVRVSFQATTQSGDVGTRDGFDQDSIGGRFDHGSGACLDAEFFT